MQRFTEINGKRIYSFRFEFMKKALGSPGGKRSLEVGCQSATDSILLQNSGATAVCSDYLRHELLKGMKEFAKKGLEGHFVLADGKALPFRDGSFDIVHNAGVLEHYREKDQDVLMSEMKRASKDLVCVFVPQKFNLYRQVVRNRKVGKHYWDEKWADYHKEFSMRSLKKMFRRNSINPLDYTGSFRHGGWFAKKRLSFLSLEIGMIGRAK